MNENTFNNNKLLIKSKPYWEVVLRPQMFIENRIESNLLKDLLTSNRIKLRGWDYPHWDREHNIIGNNFIGSYSSFRQIEEIWKFYASGQFENQFAFWEDIYPDKPQLKTQALYSLLTTQITKNNIRGDKFLEIDSTIYRVAEIYLFLSNLVIDKRFGENFVVEINLKSTEGRILFIWEQGRELHNKYECGIDNIEVKRKITKSQLIGETDELIVDTAKEIFTKFRWTNVDSSLLYQIVNNLKNKKAY